MFFNFINNNINSCWYTWHKGEKSFVRQGFFGVPSTMKLLGTPLLQHGTTATL
jgi:hypothetical protein